MVEQRTVIVPTHVVDGIIRLNREMGQKVVSRYDTGGQMSSCETVLVLEGEPSALNRDRFFAEYIARSQWDNTAVYDCDGHCYTARATESIEEEIAKARASREKSGVLDLGQLSVAHEAWLSGSPAKVAEDDPIPF